MSTIDPLIRAHFINIALPVDEQDGSIYAEDIVAEFPYAPAGHTGRLEGKAAFQAFLAAVGTFARDYDVAHFELTPLPDGYLAEYRESSVFLSTGLPYSSPIVVRFKVDGGKITRFVEYYDPIQVLRALGEYYQELLRAARPAP